MKEIKIEYIPIEEVRPNEYNPKQMTRKEAEDLERSIREFEIVDPLLVNSAEGRKGILIGGHQRLKVYRKMGIKKVPVVYRNIPDIKKERKLCLSLSKNLGSWDWDLLANFDEEELIGVGFDNDELEAGFNLTGETEEDEYDIEKAIEEIKEPTCKLGDIWQLGEHRLSCGDAKRRGDIERLMDGEKADMIFTDPPYGIKYYSPGGLDNKPLKTRRERTVSGDNLKLEKFIELIKYSFDNLREFIKSGRAIYICCNYKSFSFFEQQLLKNGFHILAIIIWVKNNTTTPLGTAGDYAHKNEWIIKSKRRSKKAMPIIYGWKEGKHYFSETALEADVWEIKRRASQSMLHPTQKPILLINKAIINSSKRWEIVLDLFGGSGTTLMGCEKSNRKCRINDSDPKYCDIMIDRWEQYTGKKAVKIK